MTDQERKQQAAWDAVTAHAKTCEICQSPSAGLCLVAQRLMGVVFSVQPVPRVVRTERKAS